MMINVINFDLVTAITIKSYYITISFKKKQKTIVESKPYKRLCH